MSGDARTVVMTLGAVLVLVLNALLKGLADRPRPGSQGRHRPGRGGAGHSRGPGRLALGVHGIQRLLAAGAVSMSWLALCHQKRGGRGRGLPETKVRETPT